MRRKPVMALRSRRTLGHAALLAAVVLVGCGTVRSGPPPVVEVPGSFPVAGERPLPERWWLELEDDGLNEMVDEALGGNLDLLAAWDRLAEAEAVARREGAALVPEVELQASTTRTEITTTAAQGAGVGGRNEVRFGGAASWEIDLWGRVRATRDAARLDAEATREEVRGAAVTLAAEVAGRWYELAEREAQLRLLERQLEGSEQILDLVALRFRKGQTGAADVLRQRQQVEATRGERAPVRARIEVLEHELAVLTGHPPGAALPGPRPELVPLPPLPETGLPADLVARRPDVREAFRNLLAADRRAAAAVADRFPRLALTGSASFSAEDLRDVLDNWIATMTVNLVAPVIDGGRRRAEVSRTEAVVSQRIREYGSAVLTALREVEDALAEERQQRRQIESFDAQLALSTQALERLRDQYLFGAATYLDVLQALITHQELERSRVTAALALTGFRIDLYRALAGGFELERPVLASAEATGR